MKSKIIKFVSSFIAIVICALYVSSFSTSAANAYSWYCKRTNDHTQPPLPKEFEFITNHGGIYLDKIHSDPNDDVKRIYLTFDAGYENGNVAKVLDILKENDVPGAFFILSNLINTSPELVKRMAREGHCVCNHTGKHADMSKITDLNNFKNELVSIEALYKDTTGKEMSKYFRPPEGKFNERTLAFASELGYKTVFWSFAYADWDNKAQMEPNAAKKKILDNIHNGAILLLHPTSKTNAEILDEVIKELRSQGYSFGSLDEINGI